MNCVKYYDRARSKSCSGHHHPFRHFMKKMNDFRSDYPPANVEEYDHKYVLTISAPGFDKSDFEIRVSDKGLMIKGKGTKEGATRDANWRRKEFGARPFERSFSLNEKIDIEKISSSYAGGVLEVELPKMEDFHTKSFEIKVD